MQRLAWILGVVIPACGGGSGFVTGQAMVSANPNIKSASIKPFSATDGGNPGTRVLGWKIEFYSNGSGFDCMDEKIEVLGSLAIWTNQPDDGSKKYAEINQGDVSLVVISPPAISGTSAATMGLNGFSMIGGIMHVDDAYFDHINGSINASAQDNTGTTVGLSGTFKAPSCGTFK